MSVELYVTAKNGRKVAADYLRGPDNKIIFDPKGKPYLVPKGFDMNIIIDEGRRIVSDANTRAAAIFTGSDPASVSARRRTGDTLVLPALQQRAID
jgi:hypothetical protein